MMAVTAVPSHMRPAPGSVNIHIAKFPEVPKPDPSTDAAAAASGVVSAFNQALEKQDFAALSGLFTDGGYWRDHLAVTWAFRTLRGPSGIADFLEAASKSKDGFRLRKIAIDDSAKVRAPTVAALDDGGDVQGVRFFITLETVRGTGTGLVNMVQEDGQWKIFTLYTRLTALRGYEEAINGRRPQGVQHGQRPGRKNWAERRQEEAELTSAEPTVIIVGTSS